MKYFKAPWGRTLIGVSATVSFLLVIFALLLHKRMVPFVPISFVSILLPIVIGGPLLSVFFSIRAYSVGPGNEVGIHHLGWKTCLSLKGLQRIYFDREATFGSARLVGNGGLFVFSGWFSCASLGTYKAYITDHANAVVLVFADRKVVLSPGDPEAFVAAVSSLREGGGGTQT